MESVNPASRSISRAANVPASLGPKIASTALSAIDAAIEKRWGPAKERAAGLKGSSVDEKVANLTSVFARELGLVGAAAGAAAAVPAVGTGASLAASVSEFGYFTFRTGELVLTIAALHGHTQPTVEEQRAWIFSVLIFGDSAATGFTKLAGELGKGLGKKATARIPMATLRAINKAAGRTLVTKYGTKRGAVALGRALPFGIGAAVGGGANYLFANLTARHANKFFKNLPYESVVIDTDGVEGTPA